MSKRSGNNFKDLFPDGKKYPNTYKGFQYALDVVEGRILSCKFVIGACERFFKDFTNIKFKFDLDYVERYLRVTQKFEHPIGEWETATVNYEPWQCWMWSAALGFKNKETGDPKYRFIYLEVPRGNGKSCNASQAALYFLSLDGGNGNQLAAVAVKRDQARIILDGARVMAKKSKSYLDATGTKVLAHTLVHEKSNSKMVALSSDYGSMDGLNLKAAFLDELHAMRREVFDVITSGQSKRSDSLTIALTTAGFNQDSVGYSQSAYAKKVASGEVEDEQFFAAIYTVDEGDDIYAESTWRKANPNWGVSVDPITFAAKASKAMVTPVDLPNFKVKHLNIWLSEAHAFFDVKKWDECADPSLSIEQFRGHKCKIGMDISSHIDLTALGIVFRKDGKYYLFDRSYIPEATVREVRSAMYENCIGSGYLIQTTGEAIDQSKIEDEVIKLSREHKVSDVLFDPWNAVGISQGLIKKHINMVEFRMTVANLSEPTKQLDALMRQGKIVHCGSPLLRWQIQNVVCKVDAANNVYPRKSNERLKIDSIISILMALASWIQDDVQNDSVYNERPMRFI